MARRGGIGEILCLRWRKSALTVWEQFNRIERRKEQAEESVHFFLEQRGFFFRHFLNCYIDYDNFRSVFEYQLPEVDFKFVAFVEALFTSSVVLVSVVTHHFIVSLNVIEVRAVQPENAPSQIHCAFPPIMTVSNDVQLENIFSSMDRIFMLTDFMLLQEEKYLVYRRLPIIDEGSPDVPENFCNAFALALAFP